MSRPGLVLQLSFCQELSLRMLVKLLQMVGFSVTARLCPVQLILRFGLLSVQLMGLGTPLVLLIFQTFAEERQWV
jgi:hypothetical protein